ncbi:MAG: peptide chain release factor family protein [bacterium]
MNGPENRPLPRPHPAALSDKELESQCEIRVERRSGPGGQNKNKVETAVVFEHRPTGIRAEANEKRYQGENREAALWRLRIKLALQVRNPVTVDEHPSPLWRSRTGKAGRISVNPRHADFPALLAESLDFVAGCGWDIATAALALKCTTSQLVKFWKDEPPALILVNHHRQLRGLGIYK